MQVLNESTLKKVKFSLYTPEQVQKLAVVEINNIKKSGDSSVYDLKMGPLSGDQACITCKQNSKSCTGHYGYIRLVQPIFHPLFFNRIESILRLVCVNCYKCLFYGLEPVLQLPKKPKARFAFLTGKLKKTNYCTNVDCKKIEQPEIKVNALEHFIFLGQHNATPSEIYFILSNISDEQREFMGINCVLRGLVIMNLLVLPTCSRPIVEAETTICDDDLTLQYLDIIKINNQLKAEIMAAADSDKIKNLFNILKFKIAVMFNNSSTNARYNVNMRALKSIYERITGKGGHIRQNCVAKRGDKTARTVITPNPFLSMFELMIPREIAQELTIPQIVSPFNIDAVRQIFAAGEIQIIQKKGTNWQIDAKKYKQVKDGQIELGDVYWRSLQNGDFVLDNRQPTLHAPSMQGKRIVIGEPKTFSLNLANCPVYNADMDGDEMNIHVPQSIEAIVEIKTLSTPDNWLISDAHGGVNFGLVQDALLAAYLITRDDIFLGKNDWDHLLHKSNFDVCANQRRPEKYSSRWLVNVLLPADFTFCSKFIKVENGQIISGALTKADIGYQSRGLFLHMIKRYGSRVATTFLDTMQFLGVEWLTKFGYSVGLKDCRTITKDTSTFEAEYEKNPNNVDLFVERVSFQVREQITPANRLYNLIESGSKGNWLNVSQIVGVVGQQYVNGEKVVPVREKGLKNNGFISSCYYEGLDQVEYWGHLIAAREAICKTITGTPITGYLQRRMAKNIENTIYTYDNTIRNGKKVVVFDRQDACAN